MGDDGQNKGNRPPGAREQLELPLRPGAEPEPTPPPVTAPPARAFRVIKGEGKPRDQTLRTRDDLARLLLASAADLMLKRISVERAHEIERRVDKIFRLFDRAEDPLFQRLLRRELDELEAIWREGQNKRAR